MFILYSSSALSADAFFVLKRIICTGIKSGELIDLKNRKHIIDQKRIVNRHHIITGAYKYLSGFSGAKEVYINTYPTPEKRVKILLRRWNGVYEYFLGF